MAETAEFVMPKLGLTMTEGRIARWVVAPGASFAAGDAIAEIETDKIVSEIEAPSAGTVLELLEPEGTTTPVGAPIARWQPQEGGPVRAPEPGGPPAHADELPRPPAAIEVAPPSRNGEARVLSTPYARRLAREAGLDIASLRGTGLTGRIKAADVEGAKAAARQVPALQSAAPVRHALPGTGFSPARDLSFATIDVDMSRLREIERSLSRAANITLQSRHYVALACIRALAILEDSHDGVLVGFEAETPGGPRLVAMRAHPRITLSSLAAQAADLERRAGQGRLSADESGGGRVAILTGNGAARMFGPAVPASWTAALGVGAMREAFRPGPDGAPRLGHEMTLALSYAASETPHERALELLAWIKKLLEEPLSMMV